MKTIYALLSLVLFFSSILLQAQDWAGLSKRIVNQTANVKPGDMVIVQGGKHTLTLMELITAEVHRKGAHPIMVMESDLTLKALWHDKPDVNLSDYPRSLVELYKSSDINISLPSSENFQEIFKNVDPKRSALASSNTEKILGEFSAAHFSSISVNYPTRQIAEVTGLEYSTYEKMHWAAMNADYKSIADKGSRIMSMLKGARNVKITTKDGTNLSFSMGNRHVFADDGILSDEERNSNVYFARYASLPGGWMDFAPVENTVNGTVVVPRMRCDYEAMNGVSFLVKNGVLENFKAKQNGECFNRNIEPHSGNKYTVSVFTIGLNPEMKIIQNDKTDFRHNVAEGFITMSIGGSNSQYKGTVSATGGYTFPLVNPTLEIDGKVVIKDGKIVL
jgi:aminopeptidase